MHFGYFELIGGHLSISVQLTWKSKVTSQNCLEHVK